MLYELTINMAVTPTFADCSCPIHLISVELSYLLLVYLVTALVPSETACLANSPGRRSLTEVWISREVMVDLLL